MSPAKRLAAALVGLICAAALVVAFLLGGSSSGEAIAEGPRRDTAEPQAPLVAEGGAEEAPGAARREATQPPADTAATDREIAGRVVDEAHRPVASADVTCLAIAPVRPPIPEVADFDAGKLGKLLEEAERARASAPRISARTGADGRFSMRAPKGDRLQVEVRAPGFGRLEREVLASPAARVDLGDLVVLRTILVKGRVLDAAEAPVAGARVRVSDEPEALRTALGALASTLAVLDGASATPADGRFELELPRPGSFRLVASHALHPDGHYEGTAGARGSVIEGVVIRLPSPARIAGRVLRVPEGVSVQVTARRLVRPRADAAAGALDGMLGSVLEGISSGFELLGERTAEVGAGGAFELAGLEAGARYRLWAVTAGSERTRSCSEPLEVPAGASGVELVFTLGCTVSLRVIDAATGDPMVTYQVEAGLEQRIDAGPISVPFTHAMRQPVKPDARGRVELVGFRPKGDSGKLLVRVLATGYRTLEKSGVVIPREGSVDLGVLALERAAVVRVRVTSAASGQAIAGASVVLRGEGSPTSPIETESSSRSISLRARLGSDDTPRDTVLARGETDAQGCCDLTATPGAAVRVGVTAGGHAAYEGPELRLEAGEQVEHLAALSTGGTLEVTVVDARGTPVAEAAVLRRPADGGDETAREATDATGRVRFDHLASGRYELTLDAEGSAGGLRVRVDGRASSNEPRWQAVTVVEGQTASVRLEQPARGTLTGIVLHNGAPLVGASLTFVAGPQGGAEEAAQVAAQEALGALTSAFGGGSGAATTGAAGQYRLERLPVGAHRVRVSHRELSSQAELAVTVVEGETRQDLLLQTASVRGRVTDTAGQPVRGAVVRVRRAREGDQASLADAAISELTAALGLAVRQQRTDADGDYELAGVPAGIEIVIDVESASHVPATSQPFVVRAGESRRGIDLRLVEGGAIRVEVEGAETTTMLKATFAGTGEGVRPRLAMVRNGRATLRGMHPGPWKVELTGADPGREARATTVDVEAAKTARARL